MYDESTNSSKRVLEPNERISEVLFGLIMVLTFTGSLSVAEANRGEVRTMLIGAVGCNIAWGVIDGVFYLMGCLSERGRGIRSLRALRKARDPEEAHRVIADSLPPMVASTLGPIEYESIRQKLARLPEVPPRPRLHMSDIRGSFAVFMWVFVTTFPVAIPFIFMYDVGQAMRVSNGIAIVLLFLTGYSFGRVAEYNAWLTGLVMVAVGCVLVAITIALGG